MEELTAAAAAAAPVPEQQQPSSVLGEPDEEDHDDDGAGGTTFAEIFPPSAPALTLKEQLVHRERQRRIETERARWKHQFVITNNNTTRTTQSSSSVQQEATSETMQDFSSNIEGDRDVDPLAVVVGQPRETRTNTSTCSEDAEEQTLGGESTKAHPDEESHERLGFNMERFLRNSDSFNPQLEPMNEKEEEKSVLLERFLKDSVVAAATSGQDTNVPASDAFLGESQIQIHAPSNISDAVAQRSVSFDMDCSARHAVVDSIGGPVINDISMHAEAPSVDVSLTVGHPSSETSFDPHHPAVSNVNQGGSVSDNTDEPRVLRLTEADMLEMASLDEASIGNAPPSDREEVMSEIGELADMTTEAVSQDTRSTAMESNSMLSSSLRSATQGQPASSSSNLNKNYNTENGDPPFGSLPSVGAAAAASAYRAEEEEEPLSVEPLIEANVARVAHSLPENNLTVAAEDTSLTLRPANRQRAFSPYRQESPPLDPSANSNVLGFDYDKDAPSSPAFDGGHDSYTELPPDMWSPRGKMHVSPLHPSSRRLVSTDALGESEIAQFPAPLLTMKEEDGRVAPVTCDKSAKKDIPPEIITRQGQEGPPPPTTAGYFSTVFLGRLFTHIQSNAIMIDLSERGEGCLYLFVRMRTDSFLTVSDSQNPQIEQNVMFSSMFHLPSLLLLSFALPCLFQEVEQSRFFLLIAFSTICCSQSRSVLAQSSRHTLEAIRSETYTLATFPRWCVSAVWITVRPGLVGCVFMAGLIYLMSRFDLVLSLVVLFAQAGSCLLAGIIGVVSPAGFHPLVDLFGLVSRRNRWLLSTQANMTIHDVCFLVCWFSVSLVSLPHGNSGGTTVAASCPTAS